LPFLTTEFVERRALVEMIPPGGLSLGDFLQIAMPLTDAIATAHASGITHRDLKPANVDPVCSCRPPESRAPLDGRKTKTLALRKMRRNRLTTVSLQQ
jgi:hypothetical protein